MYHFNSIFLKGEKNTSIAPALGNYFSLVFIDLHKISYKYYLEPESLTVIFFLNYKYFLRKMYHLLPTRSHWKFRGLNRDLCRVEGGSGGGFVDAKSPRGSCHPV